MNSIKYPSILPSSSSNEINFNQYIEAQKEILQSYSLSNPSLDSFFNYLLYLHSPQSSSKSLSIQEALDLLWTSSGPGAPLISLDPLRLQLSFFIIIILSFEFFRKANLISFLTPADLLSKMRSFSMNAFRFAEIARFPYKNHDRAQIPDSIRGHKGWNRFFSRFESLRDSGLFFCDQDTKIQIMSSEFESNERKGKKKGNDLGISFIDGPLINTLKIFLFEAQSNEEKEKIFKNMIGLNEEGFLLGTPDPLTGIVSRGTLLINGKKATQTKVIPEFFQAMLVFSWNRKSNGKIEGNRLQILSSWDYALDFYDLPHLIEMLKSRDIYFREAAGVLIYPLSFNEISLLLKLGCVSSINHQEDPFFPALLDVDLIGLGLGRYPMIREMFYSKKPFFKNILFKDMMKIPEAITLMNTLIHTEERQKNPSIPFQSIHQIIASIADGSCSSDEDDTNFFLVCFSFLTHDDNESDSLDTEVSIETRVFPVLPEEKENLIRRIREEEDYESIFYIGLRRMMALSSFDIFPGLIPNEYWLENDSDHNPLLSIKGDRSFIEITPVSQGFGQMISSEEIPKILSKYNFIS